MEKLRIPGLIVLSLAMIGVSIWFYPDRPRDEQRILLAAMVLFAAIIVVLGSLYLPKGPLTAEPDGTILIRGERLRYLVVGACAAAIAILCPVVTAAALEAGWVNRIEVWFLTLVFAAIAIYLLWAAFAARVIWRLDRIGVESLYGVHWRLPWSAIASLDYIIVAGQPYLALKLEPGIEEPKIGVNRIGRWLGVPPFALGAQGSSADFDDIADHAIRLWRQARGMR